jgi:signal peptidase I
VKKTQRNLLLFSVGLLFTAFTVRECVISRVIVSGKSMNPTLENGDSGYVNKCILKLRPLRHGEIVIFHDGVDNQLVVKRVIAVPGDTVSFSFSRVYVNGNMLSEPYLKAGTLTIPRNYNNVTLGKGQYFMMGDNRANSLDSRNYGPISTSHIIGLFVP